MTGTVTETVVVIDRDSVRVVDVDMRGYGRLAGVGITSGQEKLAAIARAISGHTWWAIHHANGPLGTVDAIAEIGTLSERNHTAERFFAHHRMPMPALGLRGPVALIRDAMTREQAQRIAAQVRNDLAHTA